MIRESDSILDGLRDGSDSVRTAAISSSSGRSCIIRKRGSLKKRIGRRYENSLDKYQRRTRSVLSRHTSFSPNGGATLWICSRCSWVYAPRPGFDCRPMEREADITASSCSPAHVESVRVCVFSIGVAKEKGVVGHSETAWTGCYLCRPPSYRSCRPGKRYA